MCAVLLWILLDMYQPSNRFGLSPMMSIPLRLAERQAGAAVGNAGQTKQIVANQLACPSASLFT